MPQTARQQMVLLLAQGPVTVSDLAELLQLKVRDVVDHLEHVRRSQRHRLIVVEPARCSDCEHVFATRTRFTAPSRCPHCRSERTTEPLLQLAVAGQAGQEP